MNIRTALFAAICAAPVGAFLYHPEPARAQDQPTLPPGIVATVNGHPIRKALIEERLWREQGSVFVGYAVNETIVREEAERRGLKVTPEEQQEHMAEYKTAFVTAPGRQPRDWEMFVQRYGIKNIEERQMNEMLLRKIGEDEAAHTTLTPAETARVLHDLDREVHKVKARQVLIGVGPIYGGRSDAAAKARAEEVRTKLQAGAKWEDVALQYSDDVSTRDRGGELGYFTREQMVQPIEDAAFGAQPGDTAIQIIRIPSGYDVFQVEDHKVTPYTEAEKQKALDDTLARKKELAKQVPTWYPLLEKKYTVRKQLPY